MGFIQLAAFSLRFCNRIIVCIQQGVSQRVFIRRDPGQAVRQFPDAVFFACAGRRVAVDHEHIGSRRRFVLPQNAQKFAAFGNGQSADIILHRIAAEEWRRVENVGTNALIIDRDLRRECTAKRMAGHFDGNVLILLGIERGPLRSIGHTRAFALAFAERAGKYV